MLKIMKKISSKKLEKEQIDREKMQKKCSKIIDIVMERNEKYDGAVLDFEELGVYIRMHDKMKRLRRLLWEKKGEKLTSGEIKAEKDAIIDIAGYSLLWIYYFIENIEVDET